MKRFKNILCVMEPQNACHVVLERAAALAESNQANLTVTAVVPRVSAQVGIPGGGPGAGTFQARLSEVQARWLETLIEPYRPRDHVSTRVLTGTPFLEIIREVLRNGHDLVIKCPDSPDWLGRLFAGDDMHLLRKCPCPVWIVKPETGQPYQRILAAVDVDDGYPPAELDTRQALDGAVMEIAGGLAVSEFAELHVVHVWEAIAESTLRCSAFLRQPPAEVDAYVEQTRRHHAGLLDTLMQQTGVKLGQEAMDYLKPQLHLLKGSARQVIPALAERLAADCIVMGTVGRTGIRGFIMGNTAETILEQIDCSVLAIKPPGFVTPVALED